jgi:hypothetical protein
MERDRHRRFVVYIDRDVVRRTSGHFHGVLDQPCNTAASLVLSLY